MLKKLLTLLCALMFIGVNHAQSVWTDMPESGIPAAGERRIQPSKFRSIRIDVSALKTLLAAAPVRFSPSAESGSLPVLTLPLPNGGTGRFQLEETPVFHPDLQAKYPQIRSYTGRGLDDPSAVLKCDLTPLGFHGMIRSGIANTVFIDPAVHGNTEYYVVYNKKDYLRSKEDALWTCATPDPDGAQELEPGKLLTTAQLADFQGDTKLRRYRLALACTGEYSTFHGGTKPLVLAAMNTSMNRVNGVYETDFAVTMQIIANNDQIIYLNAATDPYTNNDGGAMLGQNQTTCNNIIGTANYDIGHVFSTGGGGIAGLGVVCGTSKANGVTGGGSPVGDPFDIDYVAHEMGHQFDGNHTFNHCGGFNNSPAGLEPGSGTTIMAYAGICGPDDVAPHSEDIFHGYSIREMGTFIYTGSGNNCAFKITTTNHNPDVNAGPNYTIPKSTPFALTATGTDVDNDTLTYTWEQMDPGNAASPPTPTSAAGPLFRSYKGGTSPTRIFPRLQDLVNNINPVWEELPGVARTMNFRVVARDNDWQAGCTDEDDVLLTVSAASGPFLVTAPNTNVTWYVGEPKTITWDVANTTAAPVSCANVRITLSTDGGFNYPIVLAASVPNNGSANIVVPNNIANTCRVRVEAVGNIFFDISNVNFKIEAPLSPTYLITPSSASVNVCVGEETSFTTNLTALAGFSSDVTLSVSGAPSGATIDIAPNPVSPSGSATITISGLTLAMAGNYALSVTGNGGTIMQNTSVALNVLPGAPGSTTLTSPADGATGIGTGTTLSWGATTFAASYLVEVATNPSFSAGSIVSSQTVNGTSLPLSNLQTESVYYWRVRAGNDCGNADLGSSFAFQTGKNLCAQNFNSTDVPKAINPNTVNTVTSTLTVATSKPINDVNVSMNILHTYTGDLLAHLVSPNGDSIQLFDQPGDPAIPFGCDGSNANLSFDDEATQTAAQLEAQCNGTPPSLNGTYQPIDALSVFKGQSSNGVWKLVVSDNYDADGGSITAWSLSFCFPDAITAGNLLVNAPLSVYTGQSETIFQSNLDLEISGIPDQGSYVLLSLPAHGTLTLNGTPLEIGDSFTQADINNNNLVYTNNNDASTTDSFLFDALDQNNDRWVHGAVFNINIIESNLVASATETLSILCASGASGQITVNATGLDGSYSYSLNGGASQSSNVFDGLSAGTYTVVVTGQFGFTAETAPITLVDPAAIVVNTSVANDDITVTATGGAGVLEYSINGVAFQSGNEFLDLANGVYTVTVRDENGCTSTAEAIVAVNSLLLTSTIVQQVLCAGGNNGEISVAVGGGQAPFSYSLNGGPGQASNVFSNLTAGTYVVVVTDDLGISATTTALVLIDPAAITVTANAVLNAISVTASGGTGTLEYSLNGSTFQAGSQFSNLANATYTVTVRDDNGCTQTATATVNVTPLSGSLQATPILCFGGTSTLTVVAANGIQPYEYKLGNSAYQSGNTFPGLSAGSYAVTIRDASGTTILLGPINIGEPAQLNVSVTVSGNDGTPIIFGGTTPYNFSSDAPNANLQNLPNGTYHVTATDANGCSATTTFTISVATLELSFVTNSLLCYGGNDGVVTGNGTGGIPPYEYSLSGSAFQTSNVFSNLAGGFYLLTVRDAAGSTSEQTVEIQEPSLLTVTATANSNSIVAAADGGTPNYVYSLNGGTAQTSGTFNNLAPGSYTVVATDANGCTASLTGLIIMSGTVEPGEAWGLSVSPNPSTGLFVLTLQSAPDALHAQIFDATGRLLQSLELQPQGGSLTTTLHLEHLPQGTYLLRLSDGQNWGGIRLSKVGQ